MKIQNFKIKRTSRGTNILIFLIFTLSITTIIAENPLSTSLVEGKNILEINEYFPPIYASELVKKYPQIESVSISEYFGTFGYINIMGGIGTNILIESSKNYEIYVNESMTIYLID